MSTSEAISRRSAEIDRLLKRLKKLGPYDLPDAFINDSAVRPLVELRAIEAVPVLCNQITAQGMGAQPGVVRPAAEALSQLGGSSIPGIYRSLEEKSKSEAEIKLFAFVLRSIDLHEELTVFRLELEIKHRSEETKRNALFKENARKLLKCFATPDFFRFENNPFYGH